MSATEKDVSKGGVVVVPERFVTNSLPSLAFIYLLNSTLLSFAKPL
jgi:hypothetical protein